MPENNEVRLNQEVVVYATNKNFLNIFDALEIDKLRLTLAEYGQKGYTSAVVWLDRDEMLFLAHMVTMGFFQRSVLMPGKQAAVGRWDKFSGSERDGKVESRTFSLEWAPGDNQEYAAYPYRITVANGPGRKNDSGAVMPAGTPTAKVSFRIPAHDLINICLQVKLFLEADAVIRFNSRKAANLAKQKQEMEKRSSES
jgi:hypothetical protein